MEKDLSVQLLLFFEVSLLDHRRANDEKNQTHAASLDSRRTRILSNVSPSGVVIASCLAVNARSIAKGKICVWDWRSDAVSVSA